MGFTYLKMAGIYLVVGVAMTLYLGSAQTLALHPVHAHVNLLGWASLALTGLIYVQFPAAAKTRLARIHFWMHTLSLPAFVIALALLLTGRAAFAPAVEIAAAVTGLGIALCVINICINVGASLQDSPARTLPAGAATR